MPYAEKPFPKDLSNYEIDHIIPLYTFDLRDKEEIKKAFSPENHRWLTIEEHREKTNNEISLIHSHKVQGDRQKCQT